jgi:hypothetical protein
MTKKNRPSHDRVRTTYRKKMELPMMLSLKP